MTLPGSPFARSRIWHLSLLVFYVAIALVDIRGQRISEPPLIALVSAGLAAYGMLAWLGWLLARRFEDRLGRIPLLLLYLSGLAGLYLFATYVYLGIELAYRTGLS